MQVAFDLSGDIQLLAPAASVARKPAVTAPAETTNTSADQQRQQRPQDQARFAPRPAVSAENALAAQESTTYFPEVTGQGGDTPRAQGIAAYEAVAVRSDPAFAEAQTAAAAVSPVLGQVAPNTFVQAASAYTDRVIATSDFARPGEQVQFNT